MKNIYPVIVFFFMLGFSGLLADEPKLRKTHVAIFNESDFPNKSTRSVDWFKQTATEAGASVKILGLKEITSRKDFSRASFDTIIFPHGGYVPLDAEEVIGHFMGKGGTVIISGDMFEELPYPEDVKKQYQKIVKEFQNDRGGKIKEYGDFLLKNGLRESCFISYNPDLKRWIVPAVSQNYQALTCKKIMDGFALYGWPNPYNGNFLNPRPFKDAIQINSLLKPLLPDLPEMIMPPNDTRISLTRVQGPITAGIAGIGGDGAFSFNILLSLYQFAKPSGYDYPAFANAGKSEEDRNSDFFICRYHDYLHNGATLIVLGKTGNMLIGSENGEQILRNLLKLAESQLPGEYSEEYYEKFHSADSLISRLQDMNIQLRSMLVRYAKAVYTENDMETYYNVIEQLEFQKKALNESDSKYFTISQFRVKNIKLDEKQMESFLDFCRKEIAKSEELLRLYSEKLNLHAKRPSVISPKHSFKKLTWAISALGPERTYNLEDTFCELERIGVDVAPIYSPDWNLSKKLYDKTGVSSGYRFFYHGMFNPVMKEFNMGILDPKTSQVTYKKSRWFQDTAAWNQFEKEAGWFIERANKQKGISSIFYGEERNMTWSLWGNYMLGHFLKYIEEKYSSIKLLNSQWGTNYKSFSEIKLPLKRPESQTEHALWEDWTRYREIYRLQEELTPIINIAKKHAPDLIQWCYGSYYQQGEYPANGINYYEMGKLLDPASMEGGFTTREEVLTADICGFQKKVIISEWSTFYFPPNGASAQADLLKDAVWNSVNWGMIGCFTFTGCWKNSNFVSSDGLITSLGSQMREITSDLKPAQHIYLDGVREEVPVRIMYSPTTRRHTSWPGIEGDKCLEAVCGYYDALKGLHYQARAIDEMAIMEGRLPNETQVLIIPQVTYMNSELFRKIEEFIRTGGTVIATADSGRFDEYGVRQDYMLSLAGVAFNSASSNTVCGVRIGTFEKDVFSLRPIFPDESQTVLNYESGTPAGILSNIDKGKLLILGFPLGREFNSTLRKSPVTALALLKKILDTVKLEPEYICSDDHLVIRPWLYGKDRYLMLNYLQRTEMIIKKSGSGFPLKKPSDLIPFELRIRGAFEIDDYLLGKKLQSRFDGTFTTVTGTIENPGGAVYRLIPSINKNISIIEAPKEQSDVTAQIIEPSAKNMKSYNLPFDGRLFWEYGKVKLGDYIFSSDVVTDGQWAGKYYVIIEHNGKSIKKECKKGETVKFDFQGKTLIIECEDVISVMPGNIKCRIVEVLNKDTSHGCRISEEKFHGQNSIVMENDYVFIRILPGLGGRIIELKKRKDSPNNMFCDPKAVAGGPGNSWINYGGMEENAGAYPGPCWNISYKYKIIENSNGKIVLKLERSIPVKWQIRYGIKKQEGYNSFEKTFSLESDKSFLNVKIRQYNEMPSEDMLTLRTHPVLNIGGDVNPSDTIYFPDSNNNVVKIPYRSGNGATVKNNGSWGVFLDNDQQTGVIQTFSKNAVSELYTCMGTETYNLELVYDLFKVPGGGYADFDYTLGIINGVPNISGYAGNIAVSISPENKGAYGKRQSVKFMINIAVTEKTTIKAVPAIMDKNGVTIAKFNTIDSIVTPNNPIHSILDWNTNDFPDGIYYMTMRISDADGGGFESKAQFELAGNSMAVEQDKLKSFKLQLEEMKKRYNMTRDKELRSKIIKGTVILSEIETAVNANDKTRSEALQGTLNSVINQ